MLLFLVLIPYWSDSELGFTSVTLLMVERAPWAGQIVRLSTVQREIQSYYLLEHEPHQWRLVYGPPA